MSPRNAFFFLSKWIHWLFQWRWLASIVLLLLLDISTYMAFSKSTGEPLFNNQDKVMHALAFAVLFLVGYLALSFDWFPKLKGVSARLLILNWLIWMAYGGFLELGQKYLASRDASWADWIADMVGMALGTLLVYALRLQPPQAQTESKAD